MNSIIILKTILSVAYSNYFFKNHSVILIIIEVHERIVISRKQHYRKGMEYNHVLSYVII